MKMFILNNKNYNILVFDFKLYKVTQTKLCYYITGPSHEWNLAVQIDPIVLKNVTDPKQKGFLSSLCTMF